LRSTTQLIHAIFKPSRSPLTFQEAIGYFFHFVKELNSLWLKNQSQTFAFAWLWAFQKSELREQNSEQSFGLPFFTHLRLRLLFRSQRTEVRANLWVFLPFFRLALVEVNGIEPMTSCLQSRRSPN
jgi:hypothetical protein